MSRTRTPNPSAEKLWHAAALLQRDFSRTSLHAREAAREIAHVLSDTVGDLAATGVDDYRARITESIRRRPLIWLSAAAGAGALAALMATSRSRTRSQDTIR